MQTAHRWVLRSVTMRQRSRSTTLILVLAVSLVACSAQRGASESRLALSNAHDAECQSNGGLPDPACTPGATDPNVTQDNIHQTICVPGYTRRVRPPLSATTSIKRDRMGAYGYDAPLGDYELDHLIPLELAGAPLEVANLWPEPRSGPNNAADKDKTENLCHTEVCAEHIALADAQRQIAEDWRSACQRSPG